MKEKLTLLSKLAHDKYIDACNRNDEYDRGYWLGLNAVVDALICDEIDDLLRD